jgi:hypothetical protein
VVIGLGATAADARAFMANGVAAVVVEPELGSVGELPDGVLATTSWASAHAHVRLCEASGNLLRDLDRGDAVAREAQRLLDRLGRAGIPCVDRLRGDPKLRAAAIYASGRLRATDSFRAALDPSSPEALRDSLLAAWRFGEPSVVGSLYLDPPSGEATPVPSYERWESLGNPREQGLGEVVQRVRLTASNGANRSYEIACVRQPDSTWRVLAVEAVTARVR